MPSSGSAIVSNAHDVLHQVERTRSVPSGLRSDAYAPLNVPSVSANATRWPAVPANDQDAFCPGTVVVSVDGAPIATVPVTAAGTSYRRSAIEPVLSSFGSHTIAYVPVTGSVSVST